jgi:hypothetical protein
MKCHNAKKLIFEFIDGLQDDTKRLELEQHLAGCRQCDKFAAQLTRCLDILHRAPRETTSENFAWKVRLKINQERNAVRGRSASYGAIIRSWNLRYAAAAVAAAAVVVVGGLTVLKSGLAPVSRSGDPSPLVVTREPAASPASDSSNEVVADSERSPKNADHDGLWGGLLSQPPLPVNTTQPRMVNYELPGYRAPGRIIGVDVDLIDRSAPMSVAQMDSLVHVQLMSLSPDDQVQYLRQYIIVLQRHLLKAHVDRAANR